MFSFRQSLEIERPSEAVWPYLAALEQVPLWEHGILEVRVVSPRPIRRGSQITAGRIYAGKATRLTGFVEEWKPGRTGTIALSGGPHLESRVTYSVKPIGPERCLVTYAATGSLGGPLDLLSPILPLVGRWEARKNLARLRRRILAGIAPTSNESTPD
jgi:hypothetical protein